MHRRKPEREELNVKRLAVVLVVSVLLAACQSPEGGVMNKVMVDFGLKEKPEGYKTGSDRVFERMNTVGAAEMKRMNQEAQHGTVKFQKDGDLRGKYYKEVKVYEGYYPADVQPISRAAMEQGYAGYVEYAYRLYQSERKNTNTEAAAASANIATDITGRDSFKYTFGVSGDWSGGKGEKARR